MDLQLSARRVLVTGGSSGIGRATALAFAREGARVVILSRDEAGMRATEQLAKAEGLAIASVTADVTSEEQVSAAVSSAIEKLGGLDTLVHCAAISGPIAPTLAEMSVAEIRHTFDINLLGAFIVTRAVEPHLGAGSSLVFIGSDSAYVASPEMSVYNATKAGIVHMVRSLAVDWESRGVRVNAVSPSIVDTPMSRGDLGIGEEGFVDVDYPVLDAQDVANAVLFLASERARGVNGHSLLMDFGYSGKSAFPA